MKSSAPRIQRVALPADQSETSYAFPNSVQKCLLQCMPSGYEAAVEGDIRYAWAPNQTVDGGNYMPLKAGQSKGWDLGGGVPPPIRLRAQALGANQIVMLEIWE